MVLDTSEAFSVLELRAHAQLTPRNSGAISLLRHFSFTPTRPFSHSFLAVVFSSLSNKSRQDLLLNLQSDGEAFIQPARQSGARTIHQV
ncbi:hypothetical protein B0H19DRAFT_1124523 [Mycena capillaripes]|nr:hypothetical protein B0H19DRAFT_1124523 [Mycena capillaripes]